MVSLVDPATTDAAWEAGVGGRLEVLVGGRIDAREPGPVPLAVEVAALDASGPTGRAAALRVLDAPGATPPADLAGAAAPDALADAAPTGLTVVVTARRAQFATHGMFARLGLSMTGFDVVTVKMGYLEPDQYEAAADWLLALTPGGVDQDLQRLDHSRIARPMIPFDPEIPAPTAADLRRGGGS
jgi:microcystin degradation protein MlrC